MCNDFRILKIPCAEIDSINKSILFYPILKKENKALNNLLNSNNKLYRAEKDSLSALLVNGERKYKRAKKWGNIKPILVLAGIIILK